MAQNCIFFLQGRCNKGNECSFTHDQNAAAPTWPSGTPRTITLPSHHRPRKLCLFFQQGQCRKGEHCSFSRDITDAPSEVQSQPSAYAESTIIDSRSSMPCAFFQRGQCQKGASCAYYHDLTAEEAVSADPEIFEAPVEEGFLYTKQRSINGALVSFDHGASITKLSLLSDLTAVCIDGIHAGETIVSLTSFIRELGFDLEDDSIQLSYDPKSTLNRAYINGSMTNFAQQFCQRFANSAHAQRNGWSVTVTAPRLPPGSATRRVSCRKVILSWFQPTCLVWLNFGTEQIARRVREKFNRGRYRLSSGRITAEVSRGGGSRNNRVNWTVLLSGVPTPISEEEIETAIIDHYDKPRHVELGKDARRGGVQDLPVLLESLLDEFGRLDHMTQPQLQGAKYKAIAHFADDQAARQAAAELQGHAPEWLQGSKLFVSPRTSAKLKVSMKIFVAVRELLRPLEARWRSEHLTFKTYPDLAKRFVSIAIEGAEAKTVAAAVKSLDEILSGNVVKEDDQPLWDDLLEKRSMTSNALHEIHGRNDVFILRNIRKKELVYFGPEEHLSTITRQLKAFLLLQARKVDLGHEIELSDDKFNWICRIGYNSLVERLGSGVVSINAMGGRKRLTILGSTAQCAEARLILEGEEESVISGEAENILCSICWTEAEKPITTVCEHVYCLDCFEGLCTSGGSGGSEFKILCQGNMGKCGRSVDLRDLHENLSSAAIEEIFQASFASHVQKHPQKFRYCPTPDCGYIYGVTAEPVSKTCPKCIEAVCTACHAQHGTVSCAEYKDIASGGYEAFEKLKKELGIKSCPRCKTSIEKTEGCNHMTCGGCEAHICWVCMMVFRTGKETYDHLCAKHGGIGLGFDG